MPGRFAPRPPPAGDGAGLRSLVVVTEPPAPDRCGLALVVPRRAGGTRTPNRRFWRPGLCQLSYCPELSRCAPAADGLTTADETGRASVRRPRSGGRTASTPPGTGVSGGRSLP